MPTAAGLLTAPGQIGAQQPATAHNFLSAAAQMQTPGIPANSLQLLQQQAQQQLSAGTSNASNSSNYHTFQFNPPPRTTQLCPHPMPQSVRQCLRRQILATAIQSSQIRIANFWALIQSNSNNKLIVHILGLNSFNWFFSAAVYNQMLQQAAILAQQQQQQQQAMMAASLAHQQQQQQLKAEGDVLGERNQRILKRIHFNSIPIKI
jgi:hypothetical protein